MAAAKMMDLRDLVPRTPPDGLREWALETCRADLGRYGLVYEAEWVRDWGLEQLLDEYAEPKKRKAVRVTCSCCGETMLLEWAKSEKCGYGFVHPDDQEGDWAHTVTEAGDESTCPICGAKVLVNKRSAVRDYYVSAETSVMSAALVGDGMALLALTGWTVQRRIYKSGSSILKIIPAESYVFGPHDCVQLMGWRNAYSGTVGYFIRYLDRWSQPSTWKERWGYMALIFGLTADLIDRSCLPHCKLDVYMQSRPGARHYPVPYLRLYQSHPNVEAVLLHGLPMLLDDLIRKKVTSPEWEENKMGRMELPQIDWTETRPAQMLRLTKEELRMARQQCWGFLFWELFTAAKIIGERLTAKDMENAFCLGDEHVSLLIPRGQVAKSIRYLLHQLEVLGVEEDEDPLPYGVPDAQILTDYWDMSETLGRDLNDPAVRYPKNLIAAHDHASDLMKLRAESAAANQFRQRRKVLRKWTFAADGLLIRPAYSQRELTEEGDCLHHCVGSYGERHAAGMTAIFFIRRIKSPHKPYYTLQLNEKKLTVKQNRGMRNCPRTPEVQAFEDKWLAWVRAGAPRDKSGKPITADTKKRGAVA